MLKSVLALSLVMMPGAALAQTQSATDQQAATGQPPQRIRSVTVQGDEACPKAGADEIVVCSRLGAGEQFRIPAPLRQSVPTAANQSWVNRAATIDQVGRVAGGLPDTCSPVGTGGQSGCALQLNQQYAAEKRAQAQSSRVIPAAEE